MNKLSERLWEIDFLRGIAVVLMICFHILYDLTYFDVYTTSLYSGAYRLFIYAVGSTFLLLVGISLTLSYTRVQNILTKWGLYSKYLKRGLMIFGLGLLITTVTWIYPHKGFIVFGILHCIGLSIIIAYPFIRFRYFSLSLGFVLIFIGIMLMSVNVDFYWLVWLGFIPRGFTTIDYYPLLPWLGVVLLGVYLGNTLYPNHKRRFHMPNLSQCKSVSLFCFLGRHSLLVYFLHQPIILGLMYLFILH